MVKGVYKITNKRTGEIYVGQSYNVHAREGKHYKELTQGTHHNKGLQEDFDAGDKFIFEVLEKMPNATREELEEREIYYIEKFNSYNEGYNRTRGGKHDEDKGRDGVGDRLPSYKYKPVPKPKLLEKCPKCGGELVKRKHYYSTFAGCSNYPICDFTCSVKKVNFKHKKQTNHVSTSHVSTNYVSKTYSAPFSSVPCKFCGKLIKSTHKTCPFCGYDLYRGVRRSWDGKYITKNEFEKFCTQKHNYLTKDNCNYLAKKFDIDISNVQTSKKANPIIRNHLKKNGQWYLAMYELYKHDKQITDDEIGVPIEGHCPECGGLLIKVSKLFIRCESYSTCGFYCNQMYYDDEKLGISSKSNSASTTKISKSENISKTKNEKSTTAKITIKNSSSIFYQKNKINKLDKMEYNILYKSKSKNDDKTQVTGRINNNADLISDLIVIFIFFSAIGGPFLNGITNYALNPIFFILALVSTITCFIIIIYACIYERDDFGGFGAFLILGLWNLFFAFIFWARLL